MAEQPIPSKQNPNLIFAQQLQTFRSSPLPSADELIRYNEASPNAAHRIIILAENQQKHRLEIENLVINAQINESVKGQNFAFIIGIIGLLGSIGLIALGKEIGGSILGGSTLLGLVSLFIKGKAVQNKSLSKKG